ncbi:MAG: hypothetical protein FJ125_05120 [Deltaproteobacteria bacterium]|nr:hypothetical protein [Deltaproteobacteria bacterium]
MSIMPSRSFRRASKLLLASLGLATLLVGGISLAQRLWDEEERSGYDRAAPIHFDEQTGLYHYRGLIAAVDAYDESGRPILPTPEEMGVCDHEPEACPPSREHTVDPEPAGYDRAAPIRFDEETGLYHYHGLIAAVDAYDESGKPILPAQEEMGICDHEPEACPPGQAAAGPPRVASYDETLPIWLDEQTMTYHYRGLLAAVDFYDEQGEPFLPAPQELGLCEHEPGACAGRPPEGR